MHKKTLTAILAGAMTIFAANAASGKELKLNSYTNPTSLPSSAYTTPTPETRYNLNLREIYEPRGGGFLDILADAYEASEIGKRRVEKLRLKREGIPDFETPSQAMAPRKAGKAGMHIKLGENDDYRMRLYAEAYLMRDGWTRVRKPGISLTFKINY